MTKPILKKHIMAVDGQIRSLFYELTTLDIDSEDYEDVLQNIDKLTKIRQDLTTNRIAERRVNIDVNQLISGAISIGSLIAIMKYEQTDIITTKAWSIATKWLGR